MSVPPRDVAYQTQIGQDTFSKLVELCLLAGRSYDQGGWIRRGQVTLAANGTGRESPVPRGKIILPIVSFLLTLQQSGLN